MDQIVQSAYARMARMDPPRVGVARVRVRIVNRTEGHAVCGHVLAEGENVIEVYEDEVPGLKAQVEKLTPHESRVATDMYERAVKEWQAEGNDPKRAPYSIEGFVRKVTSRDPKPFDSVEVLKAGAPTEGDGKSKAGAKG